MVMIHSQLGPYGCFQPVVVFSSSTNRGNVHLWLAGEQKVWRSIFQPPVDLIRDAPQTPDSLRPDADRLRRCLRGEKNLLLAKIEQKALHVLSDKTHVTPPLPCFHGHVVRDFPQAAPRLLGVSAANSERRTRFRRGASWETTVDEETDEETEINFFFGRRSLEGLVASGGKESNSAQQVDMCGFRAASPLNYMSVRPPRRHSGNIFLLNCAWERPPWC